jgi:hypothetical protein
VKSSDTRFSDPGKPCEVKDGDISKTSDSMFNNLLTMFPKVFILYQFFMESLGELEIAWGISNAGEV